MTNAALKAPDPYLAQAIADEMALAPLLGWGRIEQPTAITPGVYVRGSNHSTFAHESGIETVSIGGWWLPRWRRDWSAGELIGLLGLSIEQDDHTVKVHHQHQYAVIAAFDAHPSRDAAIQFALVQVATQILTERRAADAEKRALNRPPGP